MEVVYSSLIKFFFRKNKGSHRAKLSNSIAPGDNRALSRAFLRYIDDPEFAARTEAEGRRTIEREFSESVMRERFRDPCCSLGLT